MNHPLRVAALACAVLLACDASAAAQQVQPCADEAARQQAVQRINALRAAGSACGAAAGPLALDARLNASAWALAVDLAERDTLSHVDAQKRPLRERLRAAGYALVVAAENVAAGQPDIDAAISAWRDSPTHCENMMGRDYVDAGLACAQRSGTRYERFWVLQLARPAAKR
jgi:uncharacterized protein YkwD